MPSCLHMAWKVPVFNSSFGLRTTVNAAPKYSVYWLPLPRAAFSDTTSRRALPRAFALRMKSFSVTKGLSDENVRL